MVTRPGVKVGGSMLGVKVRGVVKVMERGSMSDGLGSDGRWGRSLPFKNS